MKHIKPDVKARVEMVWSGGSNVTYKTTISYSPNSYYYIVKLQKHLKELTMCKDWWVYDDISGELIESKHPENHKAKAIRLYKTLKTYAAVAKELNVHPNTARTWILSEEEIRIDKEENNNAI